MRARLKPEVWDVWQYKDRSSVRPLWVLNVTELHDDVLYLRRGGDKRPVDAGNWLVRAGEQIENETDAVFRRDYEIVE